MYTGSKRRGCPDYLLVLLRRPSWSPAGAVTMIPWTLDLGSRPGVRPNILFNSQPPTTRRVGWTPSSVTAQLG